jgi:hypothetical protein
MNKIVVKGNKGRSLKIANLLGNSIQKGLDAQAVPGMRELTLRCNYIDAVRKMVAGNESGNDAQAAEAYGTMNVLVRQINAIVSERKGK